jgi:hypothetical protein
MTYATTSSTTKRRMSRDLSDAGEVCCIWFFCIKHKSFKLSCFWRFGFETLYKFVKPLQCFHCTTLTELLSMGRNVICNMSKTDIILEKEVSAPRTTLFLDAQLYNCKTVKNHRRLHIKSAYDEVVPIPL